MRPRVVLSATLLLASLVPAAHAQTFAYLAFGDSITRGKCDNGDCSNTAPGGYPPRLKTLLACGSACSVDNEGKDGEKTSAGVTRIDSVLNANSYDVLLLMHGTNDIWNNISNATIKANLAQMKSKAANRGVDTVYASIIRWHPDGPNGTSQDADVADLRNKVSDLADAGSGYFVDTWAVLCPTMSCFNTHYAPIPPDNGLHPDGSGYGIMAAEFADEITSKSTPGTPTPIDPSGDGGPPTSFTWNRESPIRATWYKVSIDGPSGSVLSEWFEAIDVCSGGSCSISPTIEWETADYSWRVRGRNPNGRSNWSPDEGFFVIAGPPAIYLGPPESLLLLSIPF